MGRFPFDQQFWFGYSMWRMEGGISRLVEPTRPRLSRSKFCAKKQIIKHRENIKIMTDSVFLLLELFDDFEVQYDELLGKDEDLIISA